MDALKKLRQECKWFLENAGTKGFPYIKCYVRASMDEARKAGATDQQINEVLNDVIENVARELGLDSWLV